MMFVLTGNGFTSVTSVFSVANNQKGFKDVEMVG